MRLGQSAEAGNLGQGAISLVQSAESREFGAWERENSAWAAGKSKPFDSLPHALWFMLPASTAAAAATAVPAAA